MRPTVIIGFDGSERSNDALTLGRRLAGASNAEVILASVYPARPSANGGFGNTQRHLDEIRGDAERALSAAEVPEPVTRRAVEASSPARGLHELAEETGAALIVIGSTHRGRLGRIAPGTTGERLLHGAPCAVAVAPAGYAEDAAGRLGPVAVACNGSDESIVALDAAIRVARVLHKPLRVITVLELFPQLGMMHGSDGEVEFFAAMRREAQHNLDQALAEVPEGIDADGVLLEGDAAKVLRGQEDVSLLVLGTSRFGRVEGTFLGSVSSRAVRGASAPVLIVPKNSHLSSLSPEGAEQWDASSSSDTTGAIRHTTH